MKIILTLFIGFISSYASNIQSQIDECKNDNIKSCYSVAIALTTRENAQNQEKKTLGLEYMRKACRYGEEKACDIVGDNYYADKNYQAAKPYLKKSCNDGKVTACEAMGTMYRDAQEVKQDDVKSREYYEKACSLGSKDSCINIAIMYRGGFGVEIDREKEKMYYKKACDAGSNAGCDSYTKMDNKDKGIEEEGFFDWIINLFK